MNWYIELVEDDILPLRPAWGIRSIQYDQYAARSSSPRSSSWAPLWGYISVSGSDSRSAAAYAPPSVIVTLLQYILTTYYSICSYYQEVVCLIFWTGKRLFTSVHWIFRTAQELFRTKQRIFWDVERTFRYVLQIYPGPHFTINTRQLGPSMSNKPKTY